MEANQLSQDDFRRMLTSNKHGMKNEEGKSRLNKKPRRVVNKEPKDQFIPSMNYRDRAKERREGTLEEEIVSKGLDFSLLNKTKQEKIIIPQVEAPEEIKCRSVMAQQLLKLLVEERRETRTDVFLTGRTMYEYNLLSEDIDHIPLTVQTSKEDCPDPNDFITGKIDAKLFKRVDDFRNDKQRRQEKKKAAPPPPPPVTQKPVDLSEEEDIFTDVRGEYIPAGAIAPVVGGYFDNLSAELTQAQVKEQDEEERIRQAQRLREQVIEKAKTATVEEDEVVPEDGYEECYPDYQGLGSAAAYDSEEEEVELKVKQAPKEKKRNQKLEKDLKKINKIMAKKLEN